MDTKTLKQTIIAGIISVFVSLRILGVFVFENHTLDMIFAVLIVAAMYFAWGYLSHWKNNNFTKEACKHTGKMWLEKEYNKGNITGENFFDEAEEIKDDK